MIKKLLLLVVIIVFCRDLIAQSIDITPDLIPYRKGQLWGYCDKNKKIVIPLQFYSAEPFIKEFAVVKFDTIRGAVIDRKGNIVINAQRDTFLFISDDGSIIVALDGKTIKRQGSNGEWFVPKKYTLHNIFSKDRYIANDGKFYGVINEKEEIIIPFRYQEIIGPDAKGFVRVVDEKGKAFFIDTTGKKVLLKIDDKYSVSIFKNDLATISLRGSYTNPMGFIDRSGKIVLPMVYRLAGEFNEGYSAVSNGYRYGYINIKGDTVVPLKYAWLSRFGDGRGEFHYGNECGFIDATGKEILRVKGNELRYINDSLIIIIRTDPGNRHERVSGIVNIEGKEVLPFIYKGLYVLYPGLISVYEKGFQHYFMDYSFNKYYED